MEGSMVVTGEIPFTTEFQDSEADSSWVTGRMDPTLRIQTTACAKDGSQLGIITRKAGKIQIWGFGIRLRFQTGIGKMFPATSPTSSNARVGVFS
jgi:hypothetical protein